HQRITTLLRGPRRRTANHFAPRGRFSERSVWPGLAGTGQDKKGTGCSLARTWTHERYKSSAPIRVHGRRYSCPARISENTQSRCVGLFLGRWRCTADNHPAPCGCQSSGGHFSSHETRWILSRSERGLRSDERACVADCAKYQGIAARPNVP